MWQTLLAQVDTAFKEYVTCRFPQRTVCWVLTADEQVIVREPDRPDAVVSVPSSSDRLTIAYLDSAFHQWHPGLFRLNGSDKSYVYRLRRYLGWALIAILERYSDTRWFGIYNSKCFITCGLFLLQLLERFGISIHQTWADDNMEWHPRARDTCALYYNLARVSLDLVPVESRGVFALVPLTDPHYSVKQSRSCAQTFLTELEAALTTVTAPLGFVPQLAGASIKLGQALIGTFYNSYPLCASHFARLQQMCEAHGLAVPRSLDVFIAFSIGTRYLDDDIVQWLDMIAVHPEARLEQCTPFLDICAFAESMTECTWEARWGYDAEMAAILERILDAANISTMENALEEASAAELWKDVLMKGFKSANEARACALWYPRYVLKWLNLVATRRLPGSSAEDVCEHGSEDEDQQWLRALKRGEATTLRMRHIELLERLAFPFTLR